MFFGTIFLLISLVIITDTFSHGQANMYYELLCPEAKKENHFLMCLYGLVCQDFPIEVNKEGVYIPNSLSTSNINWDKNTIAVTLAMCADLTAGRINHIYPKLKNIGSVTFNGNDIF